MKKLKAIYFIFSNSILIQNGFWGIFANIFQIIFLSLFFIVVAREYAPTQFAHFILATTIYQLVVSFSTMGLGQWFIREFTTEANKKNLTNKFFKIQGTLGLLFYIFNFFLAFFLYNDSEIRLLSIILGTNIIFDNLIYGISQLNIATFSQKKTAIIQAVDGFLKLLVIGLMFCFNFSIIELSILLISFRFVTLNLFIRTGSSDSVNLIQIIRSKISNQDIRKVVLVNWRFIVISSVYIVNWRLANIIISKFLTLKDVSNYEIAYKFFSLQIIVPTLISSTIFPKFILLYNSNKFKEFKSLYHIVFKSYTLFAIISYSFIYSFSNSLIPIFLGNGYSDAIECLKLMSLTVLISSTASLQANVIVSMKLERVDMIYNLIGLIINLTACILGLYFHKSILVVAYSILISVTAIHILQNLLLIKLHLTSIKKTISFYISVIAFALIYNLMSTYINEYLIFIALCVLSSVIVYFYIGRIKNQQFSENF